MLIISCQTHLYITAPLEDLVVNPGHRNEYLETPMSF